MGCLQEFIQGFPGFHEFGCEPFDIQGSGCGVQRFVFRRLLWSNTVSGRDLYLDGFTLPYKGVSEPRTAI